jgi:hypothetical protein
MVEVFVTFPKIIIIIIIMEIKSGIIYFLKKKKNLPKARIITFSVHGTTE